MNTISEKAYAKLNISLDVTSRRDDGYHDMLMVMQSVSLCDTVTIAFDDSGEIKASCGLSFIPGDERNLAVKAALVYLEAAGRKPQGMHIKLDKCIPVGAGMAGGSADAAAVLRALNRYYDRPLDEAALLELSAKVGSDVPFCLNGGTALASGRGEKLECLPGMPDCEFVICKPSFSISTPELFKKLDQINLRHHPDTAGIIAALGNEDLGQIARRMYNVFEAVDDRRLRVVSAIKHQLLDAGALGAIMTGTGSAVFGVFRRGSVPKSLCPRLRKEYGFCEIASCAERISV